MIFRNSISVSRLAQVNDFDSMLYPVLFQSFVHLSYLYKHFVFHHNCFYPGGKIDPCSKSEVHLLLLNIPFKKYKNNKIKIIAPAYFEKIKMTELVQKSRDQSKT